MLTQRDLELAMPRHEHALGGAPTVGYDEQSDSHDKATRKQRKREAKIRRDAERPPASFERFRILAELVKEGRQIIDLVDHRARYALVVIGALNAAVFILMSRGDLFATALLPGRPWLMAILAVYAAVTVLFVYYAVDCMRPRRMHYAHLMNANGSAASSGPHGPRGLLYWETIANYDLDGYRRSWSAAHMDQLNAEVVIIAHEQALLIREKYRVLGRLYSGLAILVLLAGALVGIGAMFSL
jgi:hypothetical protein